MTEIVDNFFNKKKIPIPPSRPVQATSILLLARYEEISYPSRIIEHVVFISSIQELRMCYHCVFLRGRSWWLRRHWCWKHVISETSEFHYDCCKHSNCEVYCIMDANFNCLCFAAIPTVVGFLVVYCNTAAYTDGFAMKTFPVVTIWPSCMLLILDVGCWISSCCVGKCDSPSLQLESPLARNSAFPANCKAFTNH